MTIAPVATTALYGGILGLIYLVLTINVIRYRFTLKVDLGDGGQEPLNLAIRAHANFAEYVPLILLLIGLCEALLTRQLIIHLLGGGLVLARVLHGWGLARSGGGSPGRMIGMVLT
ncbi:MAG: MAPEG family protein, partial [Ferrovibrionaceae bacterium]